MRLAHLSSQYAQCIASLHITILGAGTIAIHDNRVPFARGEKQILLYAMNTLGIHKTAELVVYAIRAGLVNVP